MHSRENECNSRENEANDINTLSYVFSSDGKYINPINTSKIHALGLCFISDICNLNLLGWLVSTSLETL